LYAVAFHYIHSTGIFEVSQKSEKFFSGYKHTTYFFILQHIFIKNMVQRLFLMSVYDFKFALHFNYIILRGCREPLAPCRIPKAAPLAGCGTASHNRSSALKRVNF
jgi:hypothetical protein